MSSTVIERIACPSSQEIASAISAHVPVIFTGMMDRCLASRAWHLPYLREKLAGIDANVIEQDSPLIHWDPRRGLPLATVTFERFVERIFDRHSAPYGYLQDDLNAFPVLKRDYDPSALMIAAPVVRTKFWLSNRGLVTPLHYDPVETFHWVIRGTKTFRCSPPGLRAYYPFPADSDAPFISQVDPLRPDFRRYPRFRKARETVFRLDEGEVLYLPAYWWHHVTSESDVNISLNFIWFAPIRRELTHFGQYRRTRAHVRRQMAKARVLEKRLEGKGER